MAGNVAGHMHLRWHDLATALPNKPLRGRSSLIICQQIYISAGLFAANNADFISVTYFSTFWHWRLVPHTLPQTASVTTFRLVFIRK